MKVNIKVMEYFLRYQGEKYITPQKAGELKEVMETFKRDGQVARAAFQELAKQVDEQLETFKMQRVSGWMNQAQFGRPHFWCYFQYENDTKADPTFAIRLITIDDKLGISVEVSFIERGSVPETVARQNQVLSVPIEAPLYYFVQENGVSHREDGTEESRQNLQKKIAEGIARKVLVKYDIPRLSEYDSDDALVAELLKGFKLLAPYFDATTA